MTKRIFVVGTDTGVGKTTVSAALLARAGHHGLRVAGFKPAESGCVTDMAGRLVPADAVLLREAAGGWQSLEQVCPYRFADPVAPGVAADTEGVTLDFSVIAGGLGVTADFALWEGAGGLMVPLGAGRWLPDLIGMLGLPTLVVARSGLGTINHTILTVEALRRRSLDVVGIVFCDEHEGLEAGFVRRNQLEIVGATGVPVLGRMPRMAAEKARSVETLRESGWADDVLDGLGLLVK